MFLWGIIYGNVQLSKRAITRVEAVQLGKVKNLLFFSTRDMRLVIVPENLFWFGDPYQINTRSQIRRIIDILLTYTRVISSKHASIRISLKTYEDRGRRLE